MTREHKLIQAVRENFGIDASLRTRRREVVDARNAIMVALRKYHTFADIGKMFPYNARKDGKVVVRSMSHCTVLHAYNQHHHRYDADLNKRIYYNQLYCEIYEYCLDYLGQEGNKPMSVSELREKMQYHRYLEKEANEQNKHLKDQFREYRKSRDEEVTLLEKEIAKLQKQLTKVEVERDKVKTAFTALYNEKKARSEINK